MSLTYHLDGDVLLVTEAIHSFTTTRTSTVRYHLVDKTVQVNRDPVRPMGQATINWVRAHYLPQVGLKDFP